MRPGGFGRTFGFTGSAAARVAAAVVYAAVAFTLVWWTERASGRQEEAGAIAPAPAGASESAVLSLQATFEVAEWRVVVGGRDIAPDAADARSWSAGLALPPKGDVVVEAAGADLLDEEARAVRVLLAGDGRRAETILWGEGVVSGSLALPSRGGDE